MILLTQLILVHLIGDFLLQSGSWKDEKEKYVWRAPALYYHVLTHLVLLMLLVILTDPGLWYIALVIAATHLSFGLAMAAYHPIIY